MLKWSFPFTSLGSRSDPLGRYVVVWRLMDCVTCNFVCIYVPPSYTQTFQDLGDVILDLPPGLTIIGGGCNAMLIGRWISLAGPVAECNRQTLDSRHGCHQRDYATCGELGTPTLDSTHILQRRIILTLELTIFLCLPRMSVRIQGLAYSREGSRTTPRYSCLWAEIGRACGGKECRS